MSGQVIVASYERVSTFAQAQHGFSLGAQAQDIDAFVAKVGWVLPDYLRFRDGEDRNASGASWDLPGLNSMLDAARRGEFQVLVVPDFDRLARSMTKALVLREELAKLGVRTVFMRSPVDETPEGRLLENTMMSFAEYERMKIGLRTNRGRRAKAERGLVVGSGKAPYGYRYTLGSREQRVGLELDPETEPMALRILTDLFTRSSIDVALTLQKEGIPPPTGNGRWDAATVLRIARNSVYKGRLRYSRKNPIYIEVPALIEEHRWEALQKVIDDRRTLRKRRGRCPVEQDSYILRGRLTCGHCGGAVATDSNGTYRYYTCLRTAPKVAERYGTAQCDLPRVPAQALEDHLWSMISVTLLDPDALEGGLDATADQEHAGDRVRRERVAIIETAVAEEVTRLERQARRLGDLDPGTAVEAAILRDMRTIEAKIARFRDEKDELLAVAPLSLTPDTVATIRAFADRAVAGLEHATTVDRREMIEILGITGVFRAGDDRAPKVGRHRVSMDWEGMITLSTSGARFKNYINGRWVDARSGAEFERANPATGELIGTFAKSGAEDVAVAVDAATEAFKKWRLFPAPRRGEILYRVGQMLIERKEALARAMTEEMGKVLSEARGDVQEGIDMTFYMAGEGRRLWGQTTPSELPNKWNMSVRKPLGVVGMITPWNFPLAIPTWKMMPALIAGNTVVWKPASYTPRMAVMLLEILEEAGLPAGVVNLVLGGGEDVGSALVKHPDVALISFTGSNDTGTETAVECARLGKRVSLEMGGKNAIIVMDDADVNLAAEGILWSAFGTSGQRCTAASRVVAHHSLADDVVHELAKRAGAMKLGNGLDEATDIGPVVSASQLERMHLYVAVAEQEGASVAVGGGIADRDDLSKGFFHEPTIFANVKAGMRVAQEEIFGPMTSVIPVDSLEEALDVVNGVEYGLSASIYTRDVNRAFRAMQDIYTGILYINAGTIGAEIQLPFGGTKATGNGHREAGIAALDVVTEWQSIYVDYSGRLQKAQIDEI